mmetsp:Transcript_150593/g.419738  ORF Transcript_150593/g.419738 Transcript_150593/m.419738 type:complete len:268 (-) Transcript_150593:126-929(-)
MEVVDLLAGANLHATLADRLLAVHAARRVLLRVAGLAVLVQRSLVVRPGQLDLLQVVYDRPAAEVAAKRILLHVPVHAVPIRVQRDALRAPGQLDHGLGVGYGRRGRPRAHSGCPGCAHVIVPEGLPALVAAGPVVHVGLLVVAPGTAAIPTAAPLGSLAAGGAYTSAFAGTRVGTVGAGTGAWGAAANAGAGVRGAAPATATGRPLASERVRILAGLVYVGDLACLGVLHHDDLLTDGIMAVHTSESVRRNVLLLAAGVVMQRHGL